jgi:hypothetical protein
MSISYNEPITFGRHGTATNLHCVGIDFLEEGDHSWTTAPVAELDIQLPFARHDVVFELIAAPFLIPGVVPVQNVFIFMSGMFVGFCAVTDHGSRSFPVHRSVVSGRAARLSLVIPTATSPKASHQGDDMRDLGLCLSSMTFRTAA